MVKIVIFDIDGTLLDTERIYMQAWKLAAEEMGFPMPQIALLKTRAVNAAVAKACFQEYCGQDFPYEQVRDRRVAIGEQLIAQESPETLIKPNAHQVLQWLQSKGISLAAATNYKSTMAHLDHSGLTQYFSVIVTGDMVKKGKPEPDIFLEAAKRSGSNPDQCLVVGDTPADVLAAHAAGIPVVLIPDQVPANAQTTQLSQTILERLDQLPQWME